MRIAWMFALLVPAPTVHGAHEGALEPRIPSLIDEPCGGGLTVPGRMQPPLDAAFDPTTSRGAEEVDVLVAWSPAAGAIIGGGITGAYARVREWSLAVNTYMEASQIATRIRLVHAALTPYTESGTYLDNLYRLQDPADGPMDELHALRDQYGADVVALIADVSDVCGVAWLFYDDPAYAFSMTNVSCSSFTFAHELGHNFGCCHDRDNSGGGCYTPAAYGYRFVGESGEQWRTIMAYAPGTRIGHYSNPAVLFDGEPTGTATENNSATMPLSFPFISQYRAAQPFTDCDGNLIADMIDIAAGAAPDLNGNGIIDSCEACVGDLDGSGVVDLTDLATLLAYFGAAGGAAQGDLNGDGLIDLGDLSRLLSRFGASCP